MSNLEERKTFQTSSVLPLSALNNLWQDEAVRNSVIIFLILRVVTAVTASLMLWGSTFARPDMLFYDPATGCCNASGEIYYEAIPPHSPLATLTAPWRAYDTVWYIKIAMQGYRHDNS